jgi:hypothetical protein
MLSYMILMSSYVRNAPKNIKSGIWRCFYMSKNKVMMILSLPLLMLGIISLVLGPTTQGYATTNAGNTLSMTGNGKTAALALKAIESNGNTDQVNNFELTAANVLQIEEDDDIKITDDVSFDKARTVDINDNEKDIDIDSNGNVDFDSYPQGTYALQVITENGDRKLYEGIIVIGPENKDQVNKIIQKTIVEIIIDIDCGKGYFERDGECIKKRDKPSICYFNPMHKDCEPKDGKCPKGFGFNDDDRCIPIGKCPSGYGRGEDDETGTCYKKDKLQKCEDGSIRIPGDTCPPVRPITDECNEGEELFEGKCQIIAINPVCPPECGPTPTPTPTPIEEPEPGPILPDEELETEEPEPEPEPEEDTEEQDEEDVSEESEAQDEPTVEDE